MKVFARMNAPLFTLVTFILGTAACTRRPAPDITDAETGNGTVTTTESNSTTRATTTNNETQADSDTEVTDETESRDTIATMNAEETGPELPPCEDSTPLPQSNSIEETPSGLERCADGRVHAVDSPTCEFPTSSIWACTVPDAGNCSADADCDEKPYGHCQQKWTEGGGDPAGCGCIYGCANDGDCLEGDACICHWWESLQSECEPSDCITDVDCEEGRLCKYSDFCGEAGLFCESDADDCTFQDDCASDEICKYAKAQARWICEPVACG